MAVSITICVRRRGRERRNLSRAGSYETLTGEQGVRVRVRYTRVLEAGGSLLYFGCGNQQSCVSVLGCGVTVRTASAGEGA